jgi:serine/threonine protein kinase
MAATGHAYFVGPDEAPDKYRLRRQVGGGGEAELWEADVALAGEREQVAVKILHAWHAADMARWRDRWTEQVELLQMIRRPGVVGVHGQFEGPAMHLAGEADGAARALYLVMNWVDGHDLRDWVVEHRRPEDRLDGLRYLAQVADTLDWLHSGRATTSGRPVVHGDLSPANIIINADGQAVLVDFGLFRIAQQVTTMAAGTPVTARRRCSREASTAQRPTATPSAVSPTTS